MNRADVTFMAEMAARAIEQANESNPGLPLTDPVMLVLCLRNFADCVRGVPELVQQPPEPVPQVAPDVHPAPAPAVHRIADEAKCRAPRASVEPPRRSGLDALWHAPSPRRKVAA